MDKIILIYPSLLYSSASNDIMILPLSLIYIATPLKDRFDIVIVDQRVDHHWRRTLEKELATGRTVCVGISTMTGPQISGAIRAAAIIRKSAPGVPIVWGGVHPSLTPEQTIRDAYVDIVVIGDGEETFHQLVDVIQKKSDKQAVRGIIYKDNGKVVRTPPREQFPIATMALPAYDLVDVTKYRIEPMWGGDNALPVLTSRGCHKSCSYCYNVKFSQRRWTSLTPEQTVALIEGLIQKYGIRNIFLIDDNFFVNMKRVSRICALLIEKELNIKIYNANCRVDTIAGMDIEFLQLMKKAGFKQLLIGVESGSDSVLSKIKKEITVEQVLAANTKMKQSGIKPIYAFMAGFPFESVRDIKATLRLMRRLSNDNREAFVYKLQLFTPFPGTDLFDYAAGLGVEFPASLADWIDYHYSKVNYAGFDAEHMRFLEDMHYYTMFFNKDVLGYHNPISILYSRGLDFRIKHSLYSHMFEIDPIRLIYKIRNKLFAYTGNR